MDLNIKPLIIRKTEYIGFLDEFARTRRIFSDNPDNIEILLLGKNDEHSDKLQLVEEIINDGQGKVQMKPAVEVVMSITMTMIVMNKLKMMI